MGENERIEVIHDKDKVKIKTLKYIAGVCFLLFLISVSYQYYHYVNGTDCGCAVKYFGDNNSQIDRNNLLFVYDPGCIHCIKMKPIISEFESKHNEVNVMYVKYNEMNDEQKSIVGTLKGVPTIILYNNTDKVEILGEVSLNELESRYDLFKGEKQ